MKEEDEITRLEKDTACFRACEPGADSMAAVAAYDDISYDDDIATDEELDKLDWSKFPSFGPFSEEEAIARIDEFEKELAEGKVKWISSEDAWKQLYEKYPWLR
jgi:hypothetical protein